MSMHWINSGSADSIVEIHDLRCAAGRATEVPALAGGGTAAERFFAVEGAPDRLVMIRGFASCEGRRQALDAFHARPSWPEKRRCLADIETASSIRLVRTLNPGRGLGLDSGTWPSASRAVISELRFAEQIGNYHLWLRLFLRKAGMDPLVSYATLEIENDVREVAVRQHRSEHVTFLAGHGPIPPLPAELRAMLRAPMDVLSLQPFAMPVLRAG